MQPNVQQNEIDGALGIIPPSTGDIMAVLGPCSAGTLLAPAMFGRQKELVAAFVSGPATEASAYALERVGKPVLHVRSAATTPGAAGSPTLTVAGTSVVTVPASPVPDDDYDVVFVVVNGGTIGTAGITFKVSFDGGRNYGPVTALGTAVFVVLGGGVRLNFAAGTLIAGDTVAVRTTAPQATSADLLAGLTALEQTAQKWNFVQLVTPLDATTVAVVSASLTRLRNAGKRRWAIGNLRRPNVGESEAAYATAMATIVASLSDTGIVLGAGWAKTQSSITARSYKRPVSFAAAARAMSVRPHIDLAQIDLGPLPGVTLGDANGNPDDHDESIFPGLDDLRLLTLRSVEGYQGAFVNNPKLLAPTGSDFVYLQYRRVINVVEEALDAYFKRRLSRAVRLGKNGFILEADALEIESGARSAMRLAVMGEPMASAVSFALSRTDNVASTFTLTGDARVQPLGYPKFFVINTGFYNPALRIAA